MTDVLEVEDGRLNIVVEGDEVVRVIELARDRSYLSGEVTPVEDDRDGAEEAGATAIELYNQIAELTVSRPTPRSRPAASRSPMRSPPGSSGRPTRRLQTVERRSELGRLEVIVEILRRALERLAAAASVQRLAQTNGKSSLNR